MNGYWDGGRFVLASTVQDQVARYKRALEDICKTAPGNGEDCSHLIAKRALGLDSPTERMMQQERDMRCKHGTPLDRPCSYCETKEGNDRE